MDSLTDTLNFIERVQENWPSISAALLAIIVAVAALINHQKRS